jgi:2-methylcitrate dehydratase PrpD
VHSTVEGTLALRRDGLVADDVEALVIRATPTHRDTCDISQPVTSLEAKFSLRYAAAVALVTGSAAEASFDDRVVTDPEVRAVLDRVEVVTDSSLGNLMATPVSARRRSGVDVDACVDVGLPAAVHDLGRQWDRLATKFRGLADPVLGHERAGHLLDLVAHLEDLPSVAPLLAACCPG